MKKNKMSKDTKRKVGGVLAIAGLTGMLLVTAAVQQRSEVVAPVLSMTSIHRASRASPLVSRASVLNGRRDKDFIASRLNEIEEENARELEKEQAEAKASEEVEAQMQRNAEAEVARQIEAKIQVAKQEQEVGKKAQEEIVIVETSKVNSTGKYFDIPLSHEQQDYIHNKCAEYGLNSAIVFGMFQQESNFRPGLVSGPNKNGSTDHGIGQINSVHFGGIADKNRVLEFEYNVDLSLQQLASHRDAQKERFSGEDLDKAMLNSYNMGQGGFRSNGYPLNRSHSNKIVEYSKKYQ